MPKVMAQALGCDPPLRCDSLMGPLFLLKMLVLNSMIKGWFPALVELLLFLKPMIVSWFPALVNLMACHQLLLEVVVGLHSGVCP